MHVGHIRSTIIGECLARLMKLQGNEVIKDNHLEIGELNSNLASTPSKEKRLT